MVIIGLFVLIGVVFGFIIMISDLDPWGFWEWVGCSFISLFGAALGGLLGILFGLMIAFALPAKMEVIDTQWNIESLQDGNSVNGNFLLGCGSVNGKMKYSFYYQYNDGYKMQQLDIDDVVVKYSDKTPVVIEHKTTMVDPKKAFINYFAIDDNSKTYDIYIPKGTIKTNYNLDAQ